MAVEIGAPTGARFPEVGLVVTAAEVPAALSRALDRLKEIGPQRILCAYDPTAGDGPDALAAFARLQAAYPAAYDLECVVVGAAISARSSRASPRAVTDAGLKLATVAVCPVGRPQVHAAGERLAGLPAARGRSTRRRGRPFRG